MSIPVDVRIIGPLPLPRRDAQDARLVSAMKSIADALQRIAKVMERPKVQVPTRILFIVGSPTQEE